MPQPDRVDRAQRLGLRARELLALPVSPEGISELAQIFQTLLKAVPPSIGALDVLAQVAKLGFLFPSETTRRLAQSLPRDLLPVFFTSVLTVLVEAGDAAYAGALYSELGLELPYSDELRALLVRSAEAAGAAERVLEIAQSSVASKYPCVQCELALLSGSRDWLRRALSEGGSQLSRLRRAHMLLTLGDARGAAKEVRVPWMVGPTATLVRARISLQQGRASRALELLEPEIRTRPQWREGLYRIGLAYVHAEQMPEADQTWLSALRMGDPRACLALAELQRRRGNLSDAREYLRTGIELGQGQLLVMRQGIPVALALGEVGIAERCLSLMIDVLGNRTEFAPLAAAIRSRRSDSNASLPQPAPWRQRILAVARASTRLEKREIAKSITNDSLMFERSTAVLHAVAVVACASDRLMLAERALGQLCACIEDDADLRRDLVSVRLALSARFIEKNRGDRADRLLELTWRDSGDARVRTAIVERCACVVLDAVQRQDYAAAEAAIAKWHPLVSADPRFGLIQAIARIDGEEAAVQSALANLNAVCTDWGKYLLAICRALKGDLGGARAIVSVLVACADNRLATLASLLCVYVSESDNTNLLGHVCQPEGSAI